MKTDNFNTNGFNIVDVESLFKALYEKKETRLSDHYIKQEKSDNKSNNDKK